MVSQDRFYCISTSRELTTEYSNVEVLRVQVLDVFAEIFIQLLGNKPLEHGDGLKLVTQVAKVSEAITAQSKGIWVLHNVFTNTAIGLFNPGHTSKSGFI